MKTLIYIGGFYCVAFAVFHLAFWRLFDWRRELPKLKPVNRGVLQVLNLRLTYVFFVVGFLCFFLPQDLLTTRLGRVLLGAVSLFCLMRAIEQPLFWKFDKISAALFAVLLAGAVIFALPLLNG